MVHLDKSDIFPNKCRLQLVGHTKDRMPCGNRVACSVRATYEVGEGGRFKEEADAAFKVIAGKYRNDDTGGGSKESLTTRLESAVSLYGGTATFSTTYEVDDPWCEEPLVVNG